MNQLRDWGFSSNWWRNDRGEYWVIGQTILSVGFVLLPIVPVGELSLPMRVLGTSIFGLIAVVFGIGGLLNLGDNLTPLPHPKDESTLVTTGIYRFVRHPLYSSVIFLALAYTIWQMSLFHGIAVLVFLLFFDRKAAQEEVWLINKFPDYQNYKLTVKKLIPGLY